MNYIKRFENYSITESNDVIKERFGELVNDKYDEIGQELKFDDTVTLGEIGGELKKEFPDIFKFECSYNRASSSSYSYGSGSSSAEEYFQVTLSYYNTEKDFEDGDPSGYYVEKVGIPSSDDDW